jgi:hypothetical protein
VTRCSGERYSHEWVKEGGHMARSPHSPNQPTRHGRLRRGNWPAP